MTKNKKKKHWGDKFTFWLTNIVQCGWLHSCKERGQTSIGSKHGSKVSTVWQGWGCSFLTCHPAPVQKPLLPLQHKGERCQTHSQVKGDAAGVRGGQDWWHCFQKGSQILWHTNHRPENSSRRDEGGEVCVEAAVDRLLKLQQRGSTWVLITWHLQPHSNNNVVETVSVAVFSVSLDLR